jgi:hypothetical protein
MCETAKNQEIKLICGGGVHCLRLEDKEHSTQFIHLTPVNFPFLAHRNSLIQLFCFLFFDKLTIDQLLFIKPTEKFFRKY